VGIDRRIHASPTPRCVPGGEPGQNRSPRVVPNNSRRSAEKEAAEERQGALQI
jgi:hypothetical protein